MLFHLLHRGTGIQMQMLLVIDTITSTGRIGTAQVFSGTVQVFWKALFRHCSGTGRHCSGVLEVKAGTAAQAHRASLQGAGVS